MRREFRADTDLGGGPPDGSLQRFAALYRQNRGEGSHASKQQDGRSKAMPPRLTPKAEDMGNGRQWHEHDDEMDDQRMEREAKYFRHG